MEAWEGAVFPYLRLQTTLLTSGREREQAVPTEASLGSCGPAPSHFGVVRGHTAGQAMLLQSGGKPAHSG
jgi:hypothetical protein